MHPRLDGMTLFPFPRSEPSMDFTRRRGPPAPLQLGAAYQAKVFRGHNKFVSPRPLESCLLVDSACDQVIRQSSHEEMRRGKDSAESKRLLQLHPVPTSYTLDETQMSSSDDGSDLTLWSYDDTLCDGSDSRSSCTLSTSSHGEVQDGKQFHKVPFAGRFAQAWSTRSHEPSVDSDSQSSASSIKIPAMCRIEQAGVHKWAEDEGQGHRRSKSI